MTSQPRKETITLHTLPNILSRILESLAFLILRSKEYNLINIFFSNIMQKMRQGD